MMFGRQTFFICPGPNAYVRHRENDSRTSKEFEEQTWKHRCFCESLDAKLSLSCYCCKTLTFFLRILGFEWKTKCKDCDLFSPTMLQLFHSSRCLLNFTFLSVLNFIWNTVTTSYQLAWWKYGWKDLHTWWTRDRSWNDMFTRLVWQTSFRELV